jgi:chemotaxis signal transduction protein
MQEPIITFEARSDWYGLPARDIFEISFIRGIRPVPRSPEIVAGLAEVHGRVVTLIDLERILGGTDRSDEAEGGQAPPATAARRSPPSRLGVVLAPPLDHLGILVRSDVDVASGGDLQHMPETAEDSGLLRARVPIGDRLLNLLFLPALVSRVEEAIRDGFRPGPDGPGEEA